MTDSRILPYLLSALGIVLILAVWAGWSQQYVKVSVLENLGYTSAARHDPWLAAEQFLTRSGSQVQRINDIHLALQAAGPEDVIFLLNDFGIPAARADALTDWLHQGGHLVMVATEVWDDEQNPTDAFLDRFGVRLHDSEIHFDAEAINARFEETLNRKPEDAGGEAATAPDSNTTTGEEDQAEPVDVADDDDTVPSTSGNECGYTRTPHITSVRYGDGEAYMDLYLTPWLTLEDTSGNATLAARKGPNPILQYDIGEGLLTVMNEYTHWHNDQIDDYDHAFFLWWLATEDNTNWLVTDAESQPLLVLLWHSSRYLLLSLLVLLLAWLYRRAVRFGPLQDDPDLDRRSLLEHLRADMAFQWRHQRAQRSIYLLRDDILQHASLKATREPEATQTPWALLAERSGLTPLQVEQAMSAEIPHRDTDFVDLVSRLQTIRNAL